MIWDIRKQKNNQSKQQEEKRIQKNKNNIIHLWDNFKQSNICFIEVPEEEKEQEVENLFEKIMKENFPNSVKERHASPGSRESQTIWMQRGPSQYYDVIIKMPTVEEKEMGGWVWENG